MELTPAQDAARQILRNGLHVGPVLALGGEPGRGKSTVLAEFCRELGGTMIRISEFLKETGRRHPLAVEESAFEVVLDALRRAHTVVVDDFEILHMTVCCHGGYPRMGWLNGACLALCDYAAETGKKLIFSYFGMLSEPVQQRQLKPGLQGFGRRITEV